LRYFFSEALQFAYHFADSPLESFKENRLVNGPDSGMEDSSKSDNRVVIADADEEGGN
jgi:hypothetical protein